jgi:hypothetical protein
MSTIAADAPKGIRAKRRRRRTALIHSPVLIAGLATTLLGGLLALAGTLGGPMVASTVQKRAKSLDVKTTLATDMTSSFTEAVGAGQRVASGLTYGPTGDRRRNAAVVQSAYNAGLGQWQVDAGRVGAELAARYNNKAFITQWRRYKNAVTRFYRLSAALSAGDRTSYVNRTWSYFTRMKRVPWASRAISLAVDWGPLYQTKKFRKNARYRRAYDKVSSVFLSLGDAFVDHMLSLHPEV